MHEHDNLQKGNHECPGGCAYLVSKRIMRTHLERTHLNDHGCLRIETTIEPTTQGNPVDGTEARWL